MMFVILREEVLGEVAPWSSLVDVKGMVEVQCNLCFGIVYLMPERKSYVSSMECIACEEGRGLDRGVTL